MNSWTLSFGACVRFTAETVLLSPCNLIHMTGAISLRKLPVQGLSIFDRLTLLLKWSRILHILIIALQSQARFKCRQLIEINYLHHESLPLSELPCKAKTLLLRSPLSRSLLCMAECYNFEAVQQEIRKALGIWAILKRRRVFLDLLDPSLPWCLFGSHLNGPASASKYLPYPGSLMEIHSRKGTPAGLTSFHLGFQSFEWLVLTLALGNKRDAASPHLHVDPQTCVILCSFT